MYAAQGVELASSSGVVKGKVNTNHAISMAVKSL